MSTTIKNIKHLVFTLSGSSTWYTLIEDSDIQRRKIKPNETLMTTDVAK
jgi:hypothetical protein